MANHQLIVKVVLAQIVYRGSTNILIHQGNKSDIIQFAPNTVYGELRESDSSFEETGSEVAEINTGITRAQID